MPLAWGTLKLQYLNQQKVSSHLSALPLQPKHPSMALIFATTLWWKGAGHRLRWKLPGQGKNPTNQFYILLNPFRSVAAKSSSATQQKVEKRSRDFVCCCCPQTADWAASGITWRTQTLVDGLIQSSKKKNYQEQEKKLTEASNNYWLVSNKLFGKYPGLNIFNSFYIQRHCKWRGFERTFYKGMYWQGFDFKLKEDRFGLASQLSISMNEMATPASPPAHHRAKLKNPKSLPAL